MNTNTEIREEAIQQIEEAQEKLNEAINMLEEVANATEDEHARAYIVDHLKIIASNSHGFLSRDYNLDEWMKDLQEDDEEDEE